MENEPALSLQSLAILAVLPFQCSACCSHAQLRFWKVRDTNGGATAYTVDKAALKAYGLNKLPELAEVTG